jgi:hypothetical protein
MTRTPASDWTPWYVDLGDSRVRCRICRDDFTKKNGRMLSHLGYICSNGQRDNNVKLCKNMKPDVLCAFRGCGGVALNLQNRSIFKVVWKVKNQYARAVKAPQCTHLVVLLTTLQPLVGLFRILQVLLSSYSHPRDRFVYGHFNKAPLRCCMPRSNDASITWLGLNSFIVQTFHSLQLDQ